VLGEIQGEQAAVPECETREQKEGDGGEAEASSKSSKHSQAHSNATQLDEEMRVIGWCCQCFSPHRSGDGNALVASLDGSTALCENPSGVYTGGA